MRKDKPSTRSVKGKLEREGTRKLHDVDIKDDSENILDKKIRER